MYQSYEKWLTNKYFDEATRAELAVLSGNEKEIEDRFYRNLEFGTGGLRGIIGAGTNRINKYVIRQATQGLASYITKQGESLKNRGVVIAHDSRHFSREFTVEAALILAQNGIKTYVFEDLRPTPELSFAVRELNALAGIVVTASHNPPKYNGYKVYWEDGGQVPPERADGILECINAIDDITQVLPMDMAEAKSQGLYIEIGSEIDQAYLSKIKGLVINPEVVKQMGDSCKIVYSPLHGTGNMLVRRALAEIGFNQVVVVPEQELPDPNFPTVKSPNPEEPAAFSLAFELAKQENADLIMATDPDADRIGIAVKEPSGDYRLLNGNQTGVLLTFYILSQLKENNKLPENGVVVKTIVTTDMVLAIARDFGVEVEQTLTGFKFIGEKIHEYEQTGNKTYLFGFEESYGYLAGTFVRDKDAVCAALLAAEAAAYYKSKGKTLYAVLQELWARYGCYQESLHTIILEGKTGQEETAFLMSRVREEGFTNFAGFAISRVEDYLTGLGKNLQSGEGYSLELSRSNVVRFLLEKGGFVVFRPSGTEPKAKIYISLLADTLENAQNLVEKVKSEILSHVEQILEEYK